MDLNSIRLTSCAIVLGLLASGSATAQVSRSGSLPYNTTVNNFYGVRSATIPKIIGGEDADWSEHQWQVALLVSWIADPRDAQFCGGSKIADTWILTAAHCVFNTSRENVNVLSGTGDLGSGGERSNVREIYVHEDYDNGTYDYDIALIRLITPAVGQAVSRLTLDEEEAVAAPGTSSTVTGWGVTDSGDSSLTLKKVSVPLVSSRQCNGPSSYDGAISDRMVCAGFTEGGRDACQGDSGGPMTTDSRLVGVVSWGRGCAEPYKYGVYARVAILNGWVNDCLENPLACRAK